MDSAPLYDVLIKQTENNFTTSDLYQKVYAKIRQVIETTQDEFVALHIDPGELLFTEHETTVAVTIKNTSRWFGVLYLLRTKDKLPLKLEIILKPEDLQGNTRDIGEGRTVGIMPPIIRYKQMPVFSQLAFQNKLRSHIIVYLPREKSRYFSTKGSVVLQPLDDDLPQNEICIPILLP